MAYLFGALFAVDPANPTMVAANAALTIYDPADNTRTPLTLTDATGLPLPNPLTTTSNGFTTSFKTPLPQVGWAAGNLTGLAWAYEALLTESISARDDAHTSALAAQRAQETAANIAKDFDVDAIKADLDAVREVPALAGQASRDAASALVAAGAAASTASSLAGDVTAAKSQASAAQVSATSASTAASAAQIAAADALTKASEALNSGGGAIVGEPGTTTVQGGKLLASMSTGRVFLGLDIGPTARMNRVTNPRFRKSPSTAPTVNLPTPLAAKVGSYNLYGAGVGGANEKSPWATRKGPAADYVRDSGASLVAVQELSNLTADQAGDVATLVGASWRSHTGRTSATLANGFLWDSTVWAMEGGSTTTEIPGTESRTITVARFRHLASNVRIIFASAHLSTDPKTVNAEQLRFIGALLKSMRDATRLEVMVGGDFAWNEADPDNGPVMPSFGLTAMKVKGTPTLTRADWGTYTDWLPAGRITSSWLDQLYVSAGVLVDAAGVEAKFANGTSLPLATPMPSDHQMVTATVRIATAPSIAFQRTDTGAVSSGNGSTTYQDSTWSADGDGGRSACIDPTGSSGTGTCFYPIANSDAMTRTGLEKGKTYTVSADFHLEGPQTGTLDSKARRITIGCLSATETAGVVNYSWKESAAAPNAKGTTRLSVTFTIPSDATQVFVRLMNGSRTEKAWWDRLLIEEAPALWPYFDGDTAGCGWDLQRDYSTSSYPGPRWVRLGV